MSTGSRPVESGSTPKDWAFASPSQTTALDVLVSDRNDRIRFVLLGRIGSARDPDHRSASDDGSSLRALAERMKRRPEQLRHEINDLRVSTRDADSRDKGLQLLKQICDRIGDEVPLVYAKRVTNYPPERAREMTLDPTWWRDLRDQPFTHPLTAIFAARVLEEVERPIAGEGALNLSTFDLPAPRFDPGDLGSMPFEEWAARRRLGRSLLHAATSASGHAFEAQITLERLCAVLLDEVVRFLHESPRWLPCAHLLNRAMRVPYRKDVDRARIQDAALQFVLSETFGTRFSQRPPRVAASLRLLRSVGLVAEPPAAGRLTRTAIDIAQDASLPSRARRYGLWIAAELHNTANDEALRSRVAALIETSMGDPELADAATVLRDHRGGHTAWPSVFPPAEANDGSFDFFSVNMRTPEGQFAWPMATSTRGLLTRHVAPQHERGVYAAPWDRVPRRLVPAARRVILEMLCYPGLVRTKDAADMLLEAGPPIATAAARSLVGLLDDPDAAVLPDHIVEGALAKLGYFRNIAALALLSRYSIEGRTETIRAEATRSLGDVLSRAGRLTRRRRVRHGDEARRILEDALTDRSTYVVQAAVLGVAGLGGVELGDRIRAVADQHASTHAGELARWCLASWDTARQSTQL